MSVYAVGDLQGCDVELGRLLEKVNFSATDKLWLVGDLINRGPNSLEVLRRIVAMGDQCEVVLGNHDLHFLAIYFGGHKPGRHDTFDDLLAASDVDSLAHWLRRQRLLHYDAAVNVAMVHAGVPHIWSLPKALALAAEVETVIAGHNPKISYKNFFENMYGNEPRSWQEGLLGMDRLRVITNYLTRMRFVSSNGTLEFQHKGPLAEAPNEYSAWFNLVDRACGAPKVLFGHWAALEGVTDRDDIVALDTGCVWGRQLTAINVATNELHSVAADQQ